MSSFATIVALTARYQYVSTVYSDIFEHVPLLRALASECDHVTEMGTRSGVSTTAFLAARPKKLVCYDLVRSETVDELLALASPTEMSFRQENTLECIIDPTDMLLIDTYHVYEHLSAELERHHQQVRRWIVLHDTEIYGEAGETPGHVGLWPAVKEFLVEHPAWSLVARLTNNNGLTVLALNAA